MEDIPPDIMRLILELRKENGLESTEVAVKRDLAKASWRLTEKPRYRRAGRSPLFISGKYLSSSGVDPITGEAENKSHGVTPAPVKSVIPRKSVVDELAFYKVLHGKGFAVKHNTNQLTGEVEKELPASLSKLELQFTPLPLNSTGVHVTQTTPQIQVAMSLDRFLQLAGINP